MDVILGVVIGWLLAVARELLAWQWRRRESARESRTELIRVARLVSSDLADAERELLGILDDRVLWGETGFRMDFWEDVRGGLVTALTKTEWETVSAAYGILGELNGMTANRSAVDSTRLKPAARPALAEVQRAIQSLSRLSS